MKSRGACGFCARFAVALVIVLVRALAMLAADNRETSVGARYRRGRRKIPLAPLAKYGRPNALSHTETSDLIAALRTWYFETGGLVLSSDARHDYFALQDALELALARPERELGADEDEFLRVLGSRLRTAMTRDVGTRRTFVFRGDPEREEPRLESAQYVDRSGERTLTLQITADGRGTVDGDDEQLKFEKLGWDAARRSSL